MSDHDRGAYAPPTDAPLSFDARQPVRGSRPLPVTLIISVLVLAGLGVAIFMFYRSGVRQAGQPPQAVGQPVAAIKAPPPAEAQPQDPAAGLQIYKTEGGHAPAAAAPQFTPPPEQPLARAGAAPPPAVVVSPPAPLAPAAPAPTLRPAIPTQPPAAAVPATPPAPASPKATTPAAKPAAIAKAEPPPVPKAAPAPAKEKAPSAAAKAAAATLGVPEPAATRPAATKAGVAAVQIGAFSSQALADKGWNDAAGIAPGLAAGKGKSVEKVDKDGKTLFRTQVTGFASRADATAFCNKLKAAGKACFVK
ncbi:MAG: SPOR domain-containing protein [Phenylobacterium sp.]